MFIYFILRRQLRIVVQTAEEGLSRASSEKFSLILLDVVMPGMDGFTLLKKLQDDNATKNVLLAAIAGQEVRAALQIGGRRLRHGGNHFIPGGMAEGVVIYFEAVDIEHADGERD